MPFELSVHRDRHLAYFRAHGTITVREAADVFRDHVQHPSFDASFTMLTNTLQLEDVNASFTGILMAAQRLLPLTKAYRSEALSVVHVNGDVAFGMARMMQQVVEPICKIRFEITRSEAQALDLAHQPDSSFADLDRALSLPPLNAPVLVAPPPKELS